MTRETILCCLVAVAVGLLAGLVLGQEFGWSKDTRAVVGVLVYFNVLGAINK